WRLRRARTISKYTGVRTLEDLLDFDFHDFFQNHCRRFLRYLRVDHRLHGLYLLASKTHDLTFIKDGNITVELAKECSRAFCRKKRILHAVDFKRYYRAQGTLSEYKIFFFLKEEPVPGFLAYIYIYCNVSTL